MSPDESARRLVEFIKSLSDFVTHHDIDSYDHIGAIIADAVLQAQKDYDKYVTPRTRRILRSGRARKP
jgi:hypothetical protein